MYWDINKTLSYNKLFNFIIGNRGGGKTYGSKKWAINRFLTKGEEFIYLRRFDSERKAIKSNFLQTMNPIFPDSKMSITKDYQIIIDGKSGGYLMALTKAADIKSLDMPNVSTIIFDEFLIEKGVHHYLTNEVRHFLNFYETIARMRDVRVLFLANSISTINPYFQFFRIKLPFGSMFNAGGEWLIELVQDQEYIDTKKQTRFASLISGTEYEEYSIENKFTMDITSFIEKKAGKCVYIFTVAWKDTLFGLWKSENGYYYFSEDIDKSCHSIVCYNHQDFKEGYILGFSAQSDKFMGLAHDRFRQGIMRFESLKAKTAFVDILNF